MNSRTPRPHRYIFRGRVRLMVDSAPWRLVLALEAIDLSLGGILARLSDSDAVEALLVEGNPYLLQLEHGRTDLAVPVVRARLRRKDAQNGMTLLAFAFDEVAAELRELVHALAVAPFDPTGQALS